MKWTPLLSFRRLFQKHSFHPFFIDQAIIPWRCHFHVFMGPSSLSPHHALRYGHSFNLIKALYNSAKRSSHLFHGIFFLLQLVFSVISLQNQYMDWMISKEFCYVHDLSTSCHWMHGIHPPSNHTALCIQLHKMLVGQKSKPPRWWLFMYNLILWMYYDQEIIIHANLHQFEHEKEEIRYPLTHSANLIKYSFQISLPERFQASSESSCKSITLVNHINPMVEIFWEVNLGKSFC